VLAREQVDEPKARVVTSGLVLGAGVAQSGDEVDLRAHVSGESLHKSLERAVRSVPT
jgi:hypothetical protein